MKKIAILMSLFVVVACGKNDSEFKSPEVLSCTVEGSTLTCPDGTQTTIPGVSEEAPQVVDVEVLDPAIILNGVINVIQVVENNVTVTVEVEVEETPKYMTVCKCYKNKKNKKRKCKKIKKK